MRRRARDALLACSLLWPLPAPTAGENATLRAPPAGAGHNGGLQLAEGRDVAAQIGTGEAFDAEGARSLLRLNGDPCEYTFPDNVQCKVCAEYKGCRWCPASKKCTNTLITCTEAGTPQEQGSCKGQVGWLTHILDFYNTTGKPFESDVDARRCLEWSLGLPLSPEGMGTVWVPDPDEPPDDWEKDLGYWACFSTLTREAARVPMEGSSTGLQDLETFPARGSQSWSSWTWRPWICQVRWRLAHTGEACSVSALGVQEFRALRRSPASPNGGGPDDITPELLESIRSGPVVPFKAGAGKSGSTFSQSMDGKVLIKVGLKQSSKMAEVDNLQQLILGIPGKVDALAQHLEDHADSVLNRYYCLMKIEVAGTTKYVLLMGDATYHVGDPENTKKALNGVMGSLQRYDLKGESRVDNVPKGTGTTLTNADFRVNEANSLIMRPDQCYSFVEAVRNDVSWLDKHNMIDYSLFVTIVKMQGGKGLDFCKDTPGEPFCYKAKDRLWRRWYTISIIDYLNDLNWFKSAEGTFVHWDKFKNYSGQILDFALQICPNYEVPVIPPTYTTPRPVRGGSAGLGPILWIALAVIIVGGVPGAHYYYTHVYLQAKGQDQAASPNQPANQVEMTHCRAHGQPPAHQQPAGSLLPPLPASSGGHPGGFGVPPSGSFAPAPLASFGSLQQQRMAPPQAWQTPPGFAAPAPPGWSSSRPGPQLPPGWACGAQGAAGATSPPAPLPLRHGAGSPTRRGW